MIRYYVLIYIIAMDFFLLSSCKKNPTETKVNEEIPLQEITRLEAYDIVLEKFLEIDSTIAIYSYEKMLNANDTIRGSYHSYSVHYKSWFFFIELGYPLSEYYNKFVFVNSLNGQMECFDSQEKPNIFDTMDRLYPVERIIESKEDAINIVLKQIIYPNFKSAVFILPTIIDIGDTVAINRYDGSYKYYFFDFQSWLFYIDTYYIIYEDDWRRHGKYVFVNCENGNFEVITASGGYRPEYFSEMDTIYYEWKPQNNIKPFIAFSDSNYSGGCHNFFAYVENDDRTSALIVDADTSLLDLSTEFKEFDLSQDIEGLDVYIDFYYYLPANYLAWVGNYCNDLVFPQKVPKKWYGKSGKVQIAISDQGEYSYNVTIIFEDIHFFDENDQNEVILDSFTLTDVLVGWFSG